MEKRFVFQEDMDLAPGDLNAVQDFAADADDHIVGDCVTRASRYAGFQAEATGITTLTVSTGRLYSDGRVYASESAFIHDFALVLPVATKKLVYIVAWGVENATGQTQREFLTNEETGAAEPRLVSTTLSRVANVNVLSGLESPDPLPPVLDANTLHIATVTLTPAGIGAVEMNATHAIDSVDSIADRTAVLEQFQAKAAPQIVALGSDMASLRSAQANVINQETIGPILGRLAVIEEKDGIPSNAAASDADFFLDAEESDAAFAGFDAIVDEGVRFPNAAADSRELAIFDSLNPKAKLVNGTLLPAYRRERRMTSGPRQAEVGAATYSYQEHSLVQRTVSRSRLRYGYSYSVSHNALFWNAAGYNYWIKTFGRPGEVFPAWDISMRYGYTLQRRPYVWVDTVEEKYWDKVTVAHAVPGAQIAETFLNANDMWLDAVGLTFTRLAAAGSATIAICETDRGIPDLGKVISVTTIDRPAMKLNIETVIPIDPVFLDGGKRYAIVFITAADHWLATTAGENFPGGTFFYILDGAYQQGDATRDLAFSLYAAKFTASRAVIELNSLDLAGGMSAIDILADTVVPGSTDLTYEVKVNNAWMPLAEGHDLAFGAGGNIPNLVPLRAIFTGTPDAMPALRLTGSRVTAARSKLAARHISKPRTLPGAGSTSIRVIARLEDFDAAHHTAVARLRTGAGHATLVNASSFVDVPVDGGAIERTWVFTLGAAVTSFRIQLDGTTDNVLDTFHFGWRKDYAL